MHTYCTTTSSYLLIHKHINTSNYYSNVKNKQIMCKKFLAKWFFFIYSPNAAISPSRENSFKKIDIFSFLRS